MDNQNDAVETAKTTMAYLKNAIVLLKEKKYFAALREVFGFFKSIYLNRIKGKYVEIKGKRIPMGVVILVLLCGAYFITPSATPSGEVKLSEKANIEPNTYDKNGVRVYDMRKCNYAACGVLENGSENDFERIRIKVIFHNQTGQAVFKGTADALQVAARTRINFEIPCSEEFAYFKLKDVVINPTENDDDEDETADDEAQ